MEDWEKKLYKKFVQSRVTNPRELKGDTVWESEQWLTGSPRELVVFIQDILEQELDRAREEGRREVYEAIVFDKNIPHDVTTFVAANLWKNMRDKAKEELSKLTTK